MKKAKKVAKTAAKKSPAKKPQKMKGDIIELILQDHKPLKRLIKILKKSDAEKSEKEPAFEEFAPLLLGHAQPEEQSLYVHMKDEDELRTEGYEGDTEHAIASQLIEEINATENEDEWMAKVKVLAELVEHHIEEEEEEMLPDVRKEIDAEMRVKIGEEYSLLREQFRAEGLPSAKNNEQENEQESETYVS